MRVMSSSPGGSKEIRYSMVQFKANMKEERTLGFKLFILSLLKFKLRVLVSSTQQSRNSIHLKLNSL